MNDVNLLRSLLNALNNPKWEFLFVAVGDAHYPVLHTGWLSQCVFRLGSADDDGNSTTMEDILWMKIWSKNREERHNINQPTHRPDVSNRTSMPYYYPPTTHNSKSTICANDDGHWLLCRWWWWRWWPRRQGCSYEDGGYRNIDWEYNTYQHVPPNHPRQGVDEIDSSWFKNTFADLFLNSFTIFIRTHENVGSFEHKYRIEALHSHSPLCEDINRRNNT